MTRREKRLAGAVGILVGLFGAIFGARALMVAPLRDIDRKTADLRQKLDKIKTERKAYFTAETALKKITQRAFTNDVDQASSRSGELLTKQISRCGLRETEFTRLPIGPRKLRGANEIGWSIQGEGELKKIVDLLFLIEEEPHVHRLENISLSSGDHPGRAKVRFRYLTLVLDPAPEVDAIELAPPAALDGPERQVYAGIIERDLLRPYIKRPPPPPAPAPEPAPAPPTPAAPSGPGPDKFRIVSLSNWGGQPEVHVRNLTNDQTTRFRLGEELAGGVVAMVDYRPLPKPGSDLLLSDSRVILKIGSEYWAVERGQTLAEKYQLKPELLPERLRNP